MGGAGTRNKGLTYGVERGYKHTGNDFSVLRVNARPVQNYTANTFLARC